MGEENLSCLLLVEYSVGDLWHGRHQDRYRSAVNRLTRTVLHIKQLSLLGDKDVLKPLLFS